MTEGVPGGFAKAGSPAGFFDPQAAGGPQPHGGPLAACLLQVARFHGRGLSPDALLSGLPLEDGVLSPSTFSRAAARAGLAGRLVQGPLEKLNPLLFPAVLILEDRGACVIHSLDPGNRRATVSFPELDEGKAEVPMDDLQSRYSGFAAYVRPEFRFDERATRTEKPREGHWFWNAIAENRPLYRDVLVASFLSNLFALAMPLFVMSVYNRVVPNRAVESLWVMALGVLVVITADFALHMARGYLVDLAAVRTNIRLSGEMMEQVLGMRAEERPPSAGSFANSIQGFETVRNFISSATVFAYVDFPFAIFFLVVIALISWTLALPLVLGIALVLLHAALVQGRMRELSETTNRASAMKNATLVESLVAMETLKSQGAEGQVQGRWEKTVAFLEGTNVRLRLLSSWVVNGMQWVQLAVSVATMALGVYLIMENRISMGSLIAAYLLSSRAMAPVAKVTALLMQYHSASRSLAALDEIMNKPAERPVGASWISRPGLGGSIEFRDVSFSYPGQEGAALSGVSFRVEKGEKVALVGRVGSGKTTLGKLLLGLYRPQGGTILVDGIDIRQLDPSELRRGIGSVPQDAMLFFGTLRENILLGNPPSLDAGIIEAARIGGVDAFANVHPLGFDLQVGERGERLSSGQRQAVALARAVLKNPPVLLLDEPTASMDHSSEERVRRNLAAFCSEKTLLLVTHRTALLDLVDRLIVLDGGRIAADGPKEDVLKALQQSSSREASR